jgi:hypothetical protein
MYKNVIVEKLIVIERAIEKRQREKNNKFSKFWILETLNLF